MKIPLRTLLSRKTTTAYFIPEIDGFRFYAIFTVLIYHLNTHISRLFLRSATPEYFQNSWVFHTAQEGGIGVNVFFAISGFILALPFAKQRLFNEKPVNLKSYYIRRLTRLEPPYVISLLLLLVVHLLILHENFSDIFPSFLASLFYVHNIVFDQWSKINPVAWSLEVEVQFYLLAPALAVFFSIKKPLWRRGLLILVIFASIVHYNLNYDWIQAFHLRKSLLMHLHQFLIGFLFADFFLTDWKEMLKLKSYSYDIIGILSLSMLLVVNDPFNLWHDILFSICLFASFIALFKGKLVNAFFTRPWVVIIGGMCYSIYLLHYALIAFFVTGTQALFVSSWSYSFNLLAQFVIVIPVVLVISAVFFVLIERPCMDKDWPAKLKAKMISIFAEQK